MNVKVNYNQIHKIGNTVSVKMEEMNQTLQEMIELIQSIKTYWQGQDATTFENNAVTYIENSKINVIELKKIGELIKTFASKYEEKDLGFEQEMRKDEE